MKRGFIRALWGVYDKSHRITQRRYRMDNDINKILKNEFNEPFTTYVYGKENYEHLLEMGLEDVILLDDNPAPFDLVKHQYRHKLEIINHAIKNYD